jgi:hypothetical protein
VSCGCTWTGTTFPPHPRDSSLLTDASFISEPSLLPIYEPPPLAARRWAVAAGLMVQPLQPRHTAPVHPIAQCVTLHGTRLCCGFARPALQQKRDRQHPACGVCVICLPRRLAQIGRPGLSIMGEVLISHVRSIDILARPIRYAGATLTVDLARQVRAKLASLITI